MRVFEKEQQNLYGSKKHFHLIRPICDAHAELSSMLPVLLNIQEKLSPELAKFTIDEKMKLNEMMYSQNSFEKYEFKFPVKVDAVNQEVKIYKPFYFLNIESDNETFEGNNYSSMLGEYRNWMKIDTKYSDFHDLIAHQLGEEENKLQALYQEFRNIQKSKQYCVLEDFLQKKFQKNELEKTIISTKCKDSTYKLIQEQGERCSIECSVCATRFEINTTHVTVNLISYKKEVASQKIQDLEKYISDLKKEIKEKYEQLEQERIEISEVYQKFDSLPKEMKYHFPNFSNIYRYFKERTSSQQMWLLSLEEWIKNYYWVFSQTDHLKKEWGWLKESQQTMQDYIKKREGQKKVTHWLSTADDMYVEAYQFLKQYSGSFGLTTLAEALTGKNTQKMRNYGLIENQRFGVLKCNTYEQNRAFLEGCVEREFARKIGNKYPMFTLLKGAKEEYEEYLLELGLKKEKKIKKTDYHNLSEWEFLFTVKESKIPKTWIKSYVKNKIQENSLSFYRFLLDACKVLEDGDPLEFIEEQLKEHYEERYFPIYQWASKTINNPFGKQILNKINRMKGQIQHA